MSTGDYATVMAQRATIMQASCGIDYAQYTTGALAFDYENQARPKGSAPDLGADEYHGDVQLQPPQNLRIETQ